MATIDSLDIQIAGSVKKANDAVNSLVKNLDKLANSLKIDTSSLEKIGQAVDLSEISNGVKDIQKQMSGFEKSAKSSMNKVSKSIDEVVKDAQNIGKGFHIEGNLSAVEKGLQKYTNELERAKLKEKELSAKGETDTNKYRDVIVDIQKYSNIIESLNRQIESMKPVESQLEINTSGLDEAKKSLDDFARELEEFRNDMKANEEVFGGLSNAPMGMFETEINNLKQTIEELKQSFPNATQVISEFEKELQKLDGIAAGLTKEPVAVKVDTSSLDKAKDDIFDKIKSLQSKFEDSGLDFVFEGNSEQLEKEIQKVNQEIDNLFNKQDRMIELGKVDTDSFKGVIRDIENATNRLKILEDARPDALNRTLEETQKKAKESEAALGEMSAKLKDLVVPPIREGNIEKLQSMLRKAEEELDRLRAKLKNGLTMGTINQSADDKGFQNLSAQIAVAEKRAGMLRQKIQDIGGSPKSTAGLEVLSSAFQGMGEAAGKATTMIKNALKGIASVVSGAFSKIGQIGKRTASAIKNVASNIASSFAKIGSSSKSLKTAHSNLGNLLKTALGFATLRGVFNFAKEAVNLGSSITEVENIVNTAFGSMAQHAYDFASTATEQFGLSELAAKQYSGTMMAMLKSSGVAQAQAAKMSTTLAGLAGDIASFYNLETDEAFYKLRSAISGETEPMKQLGVNMNIVNLEAFAMSRGINKAYREMTLAEQATLRYNYIMAKTTDAQGDFAKTSGNFANQWRLLKMNIQSVAAVLGQGIIAGILPIIKALNALMGKLMQAAKAFRNFMYVLMGKKIETTTSGIVNDLGGIGDAAGNLGELGDEAEEAGKKINKNLLLPIDELNILTDTSDDLKDSLDGIGDADMGMGDAFEGLTEEPVNEWAKRIRDAFLAQDWEELGKTIAELVNIGLKKVYDAIIDITPKVEKALKALAEVFNSFVKYLDWDLLGRTIGAGINLITTAINALLGDDGIDFEQLGSKLSVGFRGMIDEIDWTGLGNAIGNWFMVSWRIADGFIQDMWRISTETMKNGWEELGEAVGEGVNGVFDRIQFDQIARVITEGFRGIIESAASALDTIWFDEIAEKINAGLAVLENGLRWEHIGEQITKFTSAVSKAFNDLLALDFGSVGRIIGNGITDIVRAFNQLTGEGGLDFERLGTNISNGLRNLFANIPWTEFGNALGNGFMIGWRILDGFVTDVSQKDGAGLTGWAQLGISLGNAVNGVFEKISFSDITITLTDLINGLFENLKNAVDVIEWEDIADDISNGLNSGISNMRWKENGAALNSFLKELLDMLLTAAKNVHWDELGKGIGDFLSEIEWGRHLRTAVDAISETLGGLFDGLGQTSAGRATMGFAAGFAGFKAAEAFEPLIEIILNFFGIGGPAATAIAKGIELLAGVLAGAAVGGSDFIDACFDFISGILDNIIEAMQNADWAEVWHNIVSALGSIISNTQEIMGKIKAIGIELVGHLIAGLIEYILSGEAITDLAEFGFNLIEGIAKGVMSVIDALADVVKAIFDGIVNGLKKLFGIHSPSTVMAEIGGFIMQGLINGITSLVNAVEEIWQGIKDTAIKIWNSIGEFFTRIWDGIRTTAETVWNGLAEFLGNAWNFIYETAINVWNGISEFFGNIWDGIKNATESIWNGITSFLGSTWDFIKSTAATIWEAIRNVIIDVWNGVFETISSIWEGIKSFLSGVWESIKSIAVDLWNSVKSFFEETWNGIKNTAENIWNAVFVFLQGIWQKIRDIAESIWNGIKNFLSNVWSGLKETFSSIWEGIKNALVSIWNGIKNTAQTLWNFIKKFISGIWSGVKEVFSSAWNLIKSTLEGIWNGINTTASTIFGKVVDSVKKVFNGLIEFVTGVFSGNWKNAWNGVVDIFKGIFNIIPSVVEGVVNGVIGAVNGLVSGINSIGGNFGISIPSIPTVNLPRFATGGFPEDGLFLANHTELVGRFSDGRTAVANNEQIIAGIEEAAYRGFLRAQAETSPYLADIAENTRRTAEKDMSVRIGDRDIHEANKRAEARLGWTF